MKKTAFKILYDNFASASNIDKKIELLLDCNLSTLTDIQKEKLINSLDIDATRQFLDKMSYVISEKNNA